jgi:(p)ppGpp synthase/HD superfamily hydrolase
MSIANRAKEFAIAKHGTQKYGEHSYSYHLAQVSQVVAEFGYAGDGSIVAAVWLHDTPTTYDMLVSEFGIEIADIVFTASSKLIGSSGELVI